MTNNDIKKALEYTLLERDRAKDICDFAEELKTIKAEAIKEFAEIIESNDYTGGGVHLEVSRSFWDKTKKEMVGE